MKKVLTFLLTLILSVCCLFSFAGCEQKKIDNNAIVDPRVDTIKVGVIEYAPLNYMYRNTFKGFNTELAVMTFNALGYNVEFVLVEPQDKDQFIPDANDVYSALNNNEIDCFWGGISDAILFDEELFDFSYPYLENSVCLVKGSTASTVSSLEDLEGEKIAFGENSAGEKYFNEYVLGTIDDVSASSCERGQKSALHKTKSITEPEKYAIVDTLMALYQKYNGEYGDVGLTEVDLEQKNYLRVVFKDEDENQLRDNVNAMLETFAKVKKDDQCIIEQIANKYKFGNYEKSVSDFIITDFSADGGESGGNGSESAGTNEGDGLSTPPENSPSNPPENQPAGETPPTTEPEEPTENPPQAGNNGNTEDFNPSWAKPSVI